MTAGTSSLEFVLAAACCRLPGVARDLAVRGAAAQVEWRSFERVARRHRIEGLAHAALSAAGVAPVGDSLRRAASTIARDGVLMAAETARLQAALDAAGVVNLVLKGATLDILAWGRIGLKRAWDIDLLALPADAVRARAVLERAGYALDDPADGSEAAFETWVILAKEAVFRHRASGLVVELHWRATDVAMLLPGLSAASPARTVSLSAGLSLRTFADDDLFAYLCVHGTSHAWARLKWLADLGAVLARLDEGGRCALWRRASDLGAGRCPTVALLLCERILGLALPDSAVASIRADRKAARLVALALDAMAGGQGAEIAARPLMSERILLSHLTFADGWDFLVAEARRQAVSVDDRMRLRLPRAIAFLYAPLRGPLFLWRRFRRVLRRS